jgi:hypothetical protein
VAGASPSRSWKPECLVLVAVDASLATADDDFGGPWWSVQKATAGRRSTTWDRSSPPST